MSNGEKGVARNDFVIPSHTLFGHLIVNKYLSQTYTIQVKNAVALEVKKSYLFHKVSVPEDAISGTLVHCTICSLIRLKLHIM